MIGPELDIAHDQAFDIVQPFHLEIPDLRGRLVRLGPMLDVIIQRHGYPFAVAQLLAETVTAAVALASLLKYEGVFTLQAKGDGPVSLMVADVTSTGEVRGYAQFVEADLPQDRGPAAILPNLMGEGYLAFTVDQGDDTERYQGIVALEGDTMTEALRHYFVQSEQLETSMYLATSLAEGHWRGGAIIIQRLPEDEREEVMGNASPDDWPRNEMLLATATREEMLNRDLDAHTMLYRLFHEEQVRVFPPHGVNEACRCSAERVRVVLEALPAEELEELKIDGALIVTCEFCNRTYTF
jgi:molecular chaperone Hsp33